MLRAALRRSLGPIVFMAAVYLVSATIGALMVHGGNAFALRTRDRIVGHASAAAASSIAHRRGSHATAAAIDFSQNLFLAAVPDTIGGLLLVMPPVTGAYRGWVGGIVSVDGKHRSRFRSLRSGAYYVAVMLLQIAGFTLAAAAGLRLGLAFFRRETPAVGPAWFRLPRQAAVDAAALYLLIVPFFAAGSLVEFLTP